MLSYVFLFRESCICVGGTSFVIPRLTHTSGHIPGHIFLSNQISGHVLLSSQIPGHVILSSQSRGDYLKSRHIFPYQFFKTIFSCLISAEVGFEIIPGTSLGLFTNFSQFSFGAVMYPKRQEDSKKPIICVSVG